MTTVVKSLSTAPSSHVYPGPTKYHMYFHNSQLQSDKHKHHAHWKMSMRLGQVNYSVVIRESVKSWWSCGRWVRSLTGHVFLTSNIYLSQFVGPYLWYRAPSKVMGSGADRAWWMLVHPSMRCEWQSDRHKGWQWQKQGDSGWMARRCLAN